MQDFVHLHVHSQYSLLDGQASIPRLVDKAIADGMRGIAITDHGNMFAIKEFWNYVKKKNGARKDKIKELKSKIEALQAELESADFPTTEQSAELAKMKAELDSIPKEDFKAIIGCEVYVARRAMHLKEEKQDQSGYHLILLAKNKVGYHNLIKIVSRAWTEGYYMRPRTDRSDIEKYHEGLICCSACLGGEVPKRITNGDMEAAEEAVQWYKSIFGEDYYLELQLHNNLLIGKSFSVKTTKKQIFRRLARKKIFLKLYFLRINKTKTFHKKIKNKRVL